VQKVKRVKGTVALTAVVLLCAGLFLLLSLGPVKAAPGDIVRASTSSSGTQGDDYSDFPSISSDGRYVAFHSEATNLVERDTNGYGDIFRKDVAAPAISSISPTSGEVGTKVTINGSDFGLSQGSSYVKFGDKQCASGDYVSWSDAQIEVRVASEASGTVAVTVTTPGGASNSKSFTVNNPVPTTTSISPTSKTAGQPAFTLTVNGTNFVAGSKVRWKGANRTTTYVSATKLTAYIYTSDIATAGTAGVTVFNPTPGGGTSNTQTLTVNPASTPTITSVSPSSGSLGTTVTIKGTNFGSSRGTSYAKFNTTKAATTDYVSWSAAQIKVKVPSGATTGQVKVTTGAGTSNGKKFTINPVPAPTIISISPISGQAGMTVTIDGAYFGASRGSSYVKFNKTRAAETDYVSWSTYEGESTSQILVNVPSGATTGPVTVTTDGGTSNRKTFTITASSTYYLAEGTTDYGFDTYVTIQNPNPTAVTAQVTYMTKTGARERPDLTLPPTSQTVVNPRDVLGSTDFSTQVTCREGKTICVDRRMTWTGPGAPSPEGHSSVGVTSPEKTWYLPEGSSDWGFECWLLIQNPNSKEASCKVTYMIEGKGPQEFTKKVPANSRSTFSMAEDIGAHDASIKVESSLPVIPERAMYRNNRREGHDSIGTTTPATDYYLAEGATGYGPGFVTWVLVQNPQGSPTEVSITYMTQSGVVPGPSFTMPANSRKTIKVNDQLPAGTDVSTKVHGTQPIIAERAMYWDAGTGEACHDSIGMDSPHKTFYLPDGESSNGYETWTLVQNPNSSDVTVEVTYMTPTGQGNVTKTETVKGSSRRTFSMAGHSGIQGRAAIMVRSKTSGKKVMVERAMYWNSRGAGTDTIGGYSD